MKQPESQPVVFDFFCGLFGWGEAFAAHGYRVIGFDCEDQFRNFGKTMPENCELVLRDVRSITGAELVKQYGIPAVLVASPPCTEYSYMAMPWKRGKQIADAIQGKCEFPKGYKGSRTFAELNDLFNQCFRLQREISEAAGCYVPMIIENVRGAQRWVGKARWAWGSFYLWGDVPALLPIPGKSQHGLKLPPGNSTSPLWSERPISRLCDALKGEGNKTVGMNWSDQSKRGQNFTRIAGQQATEGKKLEARIYHRDGHAHTKHLTNPIEHESVKGFTPNGEPMEKNTLSRSGSKSNARKKASAEIAKIPRALAAWIAKTFKPKADAAKIAG